MWIMPLVGELTWQRDIGLPSIALSPTTTHGRTIHPGQKHRFDRRPVTSGLPRLADLLRIGRHVSNCQNLKSRVHFVGIGTGKKRPASRPTFRFTPARGGRAGADEVRRKSERERAEYAREGEVLIDSETPEDTEDRAAQLRRGPGRQRLRIQSADNFVELGASQSDRMFVVRCSSWP
jgi:hypothetical protein